MCTQVTESLFRILAIFVFLFHMLISTTRLVIVTSNFTRSASHMYMNFCAMVVYILITTGDPLTAVPNGIYESSSYLSLLI